MSYTGVMVNTIAPVALYTGEVMALLWLQKTVHKFQIGVMLDPSDGRGNPDLLGTPRSVN